jgi:hypothetical protein
MKTQKRGAGRPMAKINWPNKRFTFADLKEANDHVTPLTLRKALKRDADRKGRSEIVLLKNIFGEPDHKNGLGRKTFVYIRRTRQNALKKARKTVSVSVSTPAPAVTPAPAIVTPTQATTPIPA